jgi:hypothetical protein
MDVEAQAWRQVRPYAIMLFNAAQCSSMRTSRFRCIFKSANALHTHV